MKEKKTIGKRLFAIFCAVALTVAILPQVPFTAFAAGSEVAAAVDAWDGSEVAITGISYSDGAGNLNLADLEDDTAYSATLTADGYETVSGISVNVVSGQAILNGGAAVAMTPVFSIGWGTTGFTIYPDGDATAALLQGPASSDIATGTGREYAFSYLWPGGETESSITVTAPGTYTLSVLAGRQVIGEQDYVVSLSTGLSIGQAGSLADTTFYAIGKQTAIGDPVVVNGNNETVPGSWTYTVAVPDVAAVGGNTVTATGYGETDILGTFAPANEAYDGVTLGSVAVGTLQVINSEPTATLVEVGGSEGTDYLTIAGEAVYKADIPVTFEAQPGNEALELTQVRVEVQDASGNTIENAWVWSSASNTGGGAIVQSHGGGDGAGAVTEDDGAGAVSGDIGEFDGSDWNGSGGIGRAILFKGYVDVSVTGSGTFRVVVTAENSGGSRNPTPIIVTSQKVDLSGPVITQVQFEGTTTVPPVNPIEEIYYFGGGRLVIYISEDHFSADAALVTGLVKDGAPVPMEDGVTAAAGDGRYTWTYELAAGNYHFDGVITATDLLGNTSAAFAVSGITSRSMADIGAPIVIDQSAPVLADALLFSDAAGNEAAASAFYHQLGTVATLTLHEENLSESALNSGSYTALTLTRNGADVTSRLSGLQWSAVGDANYALRLDASVLSDDGVYVLCANAQDFAGNYALAEAIEYTFVIDGTAPQVTVAYTPADGPYFNRVRRVTITVEDDYMVDADVPFPSRGHQDVRFDLAFVAKDGEGANMQVITIDQFTLDDAASNSTKLVLTYDCNPEALYSLSLVVRDLAGNENTSYQIPDEFYIDTIAPVATITEITTRTVWQEFLRVITFGLYSNTSVQLELKGQDNLSGVQSIEYVKTEQPVDGATKEELIDSLDAIGWSAARFTTDADGVATATLPYDEESKFFFYLRVTDRAGNMGYCLSNGIIIDKTEVLEMTRPVVSAAPVGEAAGGIYTGDVRVTVDATDPASGLDGVFSGLASVTYSVKNMGVETQSGTLHAVANRNMTWEQIVANQTMPQQTITVDAALNNSNDVRVEVTATDLAGNVTVESLPLQIDISAPSISVRYNNNDVRNGHYFNTGRTATVTVYERNFDPGRTVITTNGSVSGWTFAGGDGGNGDHNAWTATVSFHADGEYTFSAHAVDLVGNASSGITYGDSVAPTDFTVDSTRPVISVAYDNNAAHSENYYNAARTATVTITERNFAAGDVRMTIQSTASNPAASGWSSSGDTHTATVRYSADGAYTFDIAYTDLAGNAAVVTDKQAFTIDTSAPEIEILGVEEASANNGELVPIISFSDENFDAQGTQVTLTGSVRGNVIPEGKTTRSVNGSTFTFNGFEYLPEVDDIYTLTATVTDLAGNRTQESRMFSVNRYGSVYEFLGVTANVLEQYYLQEPQELTIRETNVDTLVFREITVSHEGEVTVLKEGEDFTITSGAYGTWSQYTYTIFASNFEQEGLYTVTVYSEDRATNTTSNRTTKKEEAKPIDFIVDRTAPSIVLTGVEEGGRYDETNRTIMIDCTDNVAMERVEVYLNGASAPAQTYDAQTLLDSNGPVEFSVGSQNTFQTLRVVAYDRAGNVSEKETVRFLLTPNPLVQYVNNTPMMIASSVGVLAAAGLAITLLRLKKVSAGKK